MAWEDIDWSTVFGGAGQGAGAGAAVGSMFSPLGGLVGGGIGAIGGGLANMFSELDAPSYQDIFKELMGKYDSSPEKAAMNQSLLDLHAQTVEGPTAQERAALQEALTATNTAFNSKYGSIRNELMARQGIGGSTNAALAAAQGQGTSDVMADTAVKAASAESARRERFIPLEAQARIAALQMQNRWTEWASGEAYKRRKERQTMDATNMAMVAQAVGSVARLAKPAIDESRGMTALSEIQGSGPQGYTGGTDPASNLRGKSALEWLNRPEDDQDTDFGIPRPRSPASDTFDWSRLSKPQPTSPVMDTGWGYKSKGWW